MTDSSEHAALQARMDAHAAESDRRWEDLCRGLDAISDELRVHIHPEIEELAVHLIGPKRSDFEGGGRDTRLGIEGQLADLAKRVNGKVKLPWSFYGSLAGAVATVWAAVIVAS